MTKGHREQADEYFAEMEDEINTDVLNRLSLGASAHLLAAIHDALRPSGPTPIPVERLDMHFGDKEAKARIEKLEEDLERTHRALVSASESSNQHLEWYENLREDVERRASLDFTPEVTASTLRSILNDDTERRSY